MIPTYQYMNQIKTFFRFRCNIDLDVIRGKRNLFLFAKWQTSQTKDLLYLIKGNLFLITSMYLFKTCPNRKCQRVSRSLAVKLAVLVVICEDLIGLIWSFW